MAGAAGGDSVDRGSGAPGWLQLEVLSLVGLAALTGLVMLQRSSSTSGGLKSSPLAPPLAALSLLVLGSTGLALLLSLLSVALGWGLMWVVVLRQIPFVRDIVYNRPGSLSAARASSVGQGQEEAAPADPAELREHPHDD